VINEMNCILPNAFHSEPSKALVSEDSKRDFSTHTKCGDVVGSLQNKLLEADLNIQALTLELEEIKLAD
jgi:hypothetical protein